MLKGVYLTLLIGPAVRLIADPEKAVADIGQAGGLLGWLTLTAALLPALWHLGRTLARGAVMVIEPRYMVPSHVKTLIAEKIATNSDRTPNAPALADD